MLKIFVRSARSWYRFYRYLKCIRYKDAFWILVFEIIGIKTLRMIGIEKYFLWIRTASTDLYVAVSCLSKEIYSSIEASKPDVIIDAGANIGASTIYFANRYPTARIFAIEPEDENYSILKKNTKGFRNVTLIKAALWGTDEFRSIQARTTGAWGYTVADCPLSVRSTGQISECVTMKTVLERFDLNKVDILKIDIEGAEVCVFETAEEWIDRIEVISIELHERICPGCSRPFYIATRKFERVDVEGEKVTVYRK